MRNGWLMANRRRLASAARLTSLSKWKLLRRDEIGVTAAYYR